VRAKRQKAETRQGRRREIGQRSLQRSGPKVSKLRTNIRRQEQRTAEHEKHGNKGVGYQGSREEKKNASKRQETSTSMPRGASAGHEEKLRTDASRERHGKPAQGVVTGQG